VTCLELDDIIVVHVCLTLDADDKPPQLGDGTQLDNCMELSRTELDGGDAVTPLVECLISSVSAAHHLFVVITILLFIHRDNSESATFGRFLWNFCSSSFRVFFVVSRDFSALLRCVYYNLSVTHKNYEIRTVNRQS